MATRTTFRRSAEEVRAIIADLPARSRENLITLWRRELKDHPPRKMSREMMVRILAWEMQAAIFGGLNAATRKRLERIASGASLRTPAPAVTPGARLVREWNGETHVVDAGEDGHFVWKETRYASLSAVARAITGARWSGPRFFGLVARKGDHASGSVQNGDGHP
ncbi:DUF2924 domain-containing protein [Hyphobacterium sp.]|uniref:DUF2924 domain-containing protein n=1 Tax=Hyphobacterium sp. TaxID=2004662 RepID=UPI003747E11B